MAGLNFDITANNSDFLKKTEEIKKGMDALQKIREELHLKDDYAYSEKFRK